MAMAIAVEPKNPMAWVVCSGMLAGKQQIEEIKKEQKRYRSSLKAIKFDVGQITHQNREVKQKVAGIMSSIEDRGDLNTSEILTLKRNFQDALEELIQIRKELQREQQTEVAASIAIKQEHQKQWTKVIELLELLKTQAVEIPVTREREKILVAIDDSNIRKHFQEKGEQVDYKAIGASIQKNKDADYEFTFYSGYDPNNKKQVAHLEFIKSLGFTMYLKPLKRVSKQKVKANLDVEIVIDLLLERENYDRVIFMSGDGDFVPLVRVLQKFGKQVKVISPRKRTSKDLIEVADKYIALDSFQNISQPKTAKPKTNQSVLSNKKPVLLPKPVLVK